MEENPSCCSRVDAVNDIRWCLRLNWCAYVQDCKYHNPCSEAERESVRQALMVPLKIFCQEDHLGESNVASFKDTFRCTSFVHGWRLELIQNRLHDPDILLRNCTQKTNRMTFLVKRESEASTSKFLHVF